MTADNIPTSKTDRPNFIIDLSWKVFFEKITSGRIRINKESSMQLHYSSILNTAGELLCILPGETFSLEFESSHGRKNLDIACRFDDVSATIELKCFRKFSNHAQDLDMYDVWVDITRLLGLDDFQVKRFIFLTDHDKYPNGKHWGKNITVPKDITFNWVEKDGWFYFLLCV
jgi:hypothetical protein